MLLMPKGLKHNVVFFKQSILCPCMYSLWINIILTSIHVCTVNDLKFKAGIEEGRIEQQ